MVVRSQRLRSTQLYQFTCRAGQSNADPQRCGATTKSQGPDSTQRAPRFSQRQQRHLTLRSSARTSASSASKKLRRVRRSLEVALRRPGRNAEILDSETCHQSGSVRISGLLCESQRSPRLCVDFLLPPLQRYGSACRLPVYRNQFPLDELVSGTTIPETSRVGLRS